MILEYNLQYFAKDGPGGEKTEPATQKKLDDARKKGQVAKSKEVTNAFSLLAIFILMKVWAGRMGYQFMGVFQTIYERIPEIAVMYEGNIPFTTVNMIFRNTLLQILLLLAPILAVGFIIAFLSDYIQIPWKVTADPLKPKFSKLNPINGFKKFFSVSSLVELVKAVAKIGLIVYVVYQYINGLKDSIFLLYDISLNAAIAEMGKVVTDLGIRIAAVYMIIAAADLIYQRWKFKDDMKMTKQEVKDEFKNTEGNPEIKGKQRQRMREASQRRMMQALPEADVVITNPTHYAVAIKYDADAHKAPVVLAKGEDYLAQKIKEVAREHDIEIVENKPLARMLYANVDIGAEIPPELYQAVADVLAFVYHLKGRV